MQAIRRIKSALPGVSGRHLPVDRPEHADLVPAPERGEQLALVAVSGDALDHGLLRQQLELPDHDVDIRVERHRGVIAARIQRRKRRAAQHVQQVDLHGVRPKARERRSGGEHLRFPFARQAVNDVDADANSRLPQTRKAVFKHGIRVSAVDADRRRVAARLQAELHGQRRFRCEFPQKGEHRVVDAVGPRRDREAVRTGVERLAVQRAKRFDRRVGVRMRLKISDDPGLRALSADPLRFRRQLLRDGQMAARREAAAAAVAEDAAADAAGAVEVRAGHARVENRFLGVAILPPVVVG